MEPDTEEDNVRKRAHEDDENGAEEQPARKKNKAKRTYFVLPLEGIRNCEGDLFHHTGRRALCEKGLQRLQEAGITIKARRFAKAEDETIQRNWYEFADQYGLDEKDVLYLCGVNAKPGPTVMDERGAFILKTHFFPRMCRNLEHRTATAVIEAVLRLYDPVAKDPNIDYSLKFTKEEDDMLQEYYQKGWTFFKIAEAMKKPKARVKSRITYFRKQGLTRSKSIRPTGATIDDFYWMTSYTRSRNHRGYPMPETGILDTNGDFFHHGNPKYEVTLPVLERLQSHNVVIQANRLTDEEKRKALRNATEFNMSRLLFMSVLRYAKYAKALYKRHSDNWEAPDNRFFDWTPRHRELFTDANRFWPRLCEGLPARTTTAVCTAVFAVLDPANDFPGAMDPLTQEDYYELDRLYRIHHSGSDVAVWMGKPLARVRDLLRLHKRRSVPLRRAERRRLWNILAQQYTGGGPKLVRKELRKGRSKFDCKMIAKLLGRHVHVIRDAWREIIDDFREQLKEKTFDDAVEEVIPKPYRITGREFHDFLELFIDYNPNVIMRYMKFRDLDRLKMEQGMVRLGLTGFYTGFRTEFQHCIWLLGQVIYQICAQLKPVVDLTTVAKKDALKVLSKCFARQGDKPFRYLRTKDFVDTLLNHMAENHPDWQPPEGLLDWAERLAELQEKDAHSMEPDTEEDNVRKRAHEDDENGAEEQPARKKNKSKRTYFVLPLQGIRNSEGDLFHHTGRRTLCEKGLQRLQEAGITIKAKRFEKNEDEIIQRNWYEFSDQYGLDEKDILYLCGVNAKPGPTVMDERGAFILKTHFFPRMCRHLEHRAATAVIEAILRLYDPVVNDPNIDYSLKFTKEEDDMLRDYYQKGWTLFKIAGAMKKPKMRIRARIAYFRKQGLSRSRNIRAAQTPENDFYWATSYTRDERRGFLLPESGILDENGDLFYHGSPRFKLTPRCIERLNAHHVVIERTRFTDEEKRKALRNATYTKYAKALYRRNEAALKAPDERVFEWTFLQRQQFAISNRFWPRLCEGLPTRVTDAVCKMVSELIDPANDFPGAMDPLTQEDYYELDRLYRIHRSGAVTAVWFNKPLRTTLSALQNHKLRTLPLRRLERRRLWNLLAKQYPGRAERLVRKELRRGKSGIDFKMLARMISRHIHVVRNAWREIIDDFRGALVAKTFEEAVEEVIPKPYRITGREFHDFLELFMDLNPNVIMRHMIFKDVDRLRMERSMLRIGLTGFYTGHTTEFRFCAVLLRTVLRLVCRNLKPVVDLTTVARKDALKVLSKCFAARGDKPFRNLATKDFVDTLLSHMAENHPDWQPPEGLLDWAERLAELQEKDGPTNMKARRKAETNASEIGQNEVLVSLALGAVHCALVTLVNRVVPDPYMDEIFHIRQTRNYCAGVYTWDPMITTPPLLYVLAMPFCGWGERYLNSLLFPITFLGCCRLRRNFAKPDEPVILPSLAVVLLPVLLHSSALFYTDLLSLCLVVWAFSVRSIPLSALCFFISLWARQTNIIWAGLYAAVVLLRRIDTSKPFSSGLKAVLSLVPYLILAALFAGFVVWNGGIVLGDPKAHQPQLHFAQLLYFAVFCCFSASFSILPHWREILSSTLSLTSLALGAPVFFVLHKFALTHPYLLADNRHVPFYLWRWILSKPTVRQLLTPIFVVALLAMGQLSRRVPPAHRLLFVLCTVAVLVPAHLIEPRYFIVPYALWRLSAETRSTICCLLEVLSQLCIFSALFWLFLYKPFEWAHEPGPLQRFMW
ncbi:unnamed protein product, partial [Mesorhabditis spiculigera]